MLTLTVALMAVMVVAVRGGVQEGGVTVKPYDAFLTDMRAAGAAGKAVWLDPSKVCAGAGVQPIGWLAAG